MIQFDGETRIRIAAFLNQKVTEHLGTQTPAEQEAAIIQVIRAIDSGYRHTIVVDNTCEM